MTTLAFDVYGTLIDAHGLLTTLEQLVGTKALALSHTWRDKQLEYSFRKGLMRDYAPFSVCTRQALDYACAQHGADLQPEQKEELLRRYRTLPPFADVKAGLTQLQSDGFDLYAFSNGEPEALKLLLENTGIQDLFQGVISVDRIQSFKPNPDVYHYFLKLTGSTPDKTWLVSSNPFDVLGAHGAGMKTIWIRRSQTAIFDPWGIEPSLTVSNLLELHAKLPRDA